jgi:hypothetical protein
VNRLERIAAAGGTTLLALALASCTEAAAPQPDAVASFASTAGGRPPFVFPAGCCYYQGRIVRTVVPPASTPQEGLDDFFGFPSAVAVGQKAIVAVAPGASGYHGGHWKFYAVTWNVSPYLLTSAEGVATAAASGDVTVTRVADNDFKCPIQP